MMQVAKSKAINLSKSKENFRSDILLTCACCHLLPKESSCSRVTMCGCVCVCVSSQISSAILCVEDIVECSSCIHGLALVQSDSFQLFQTMSTAWMQSLSFLRHVRIQGMDVCGVVIVKFFTATSSSCYMVQLTSGVFKFIPEFLMPR